MIRLKKVKNYFQKFLGKFDLFGKKVELNFQDNDSYNTGFGGFLSISFVLILFLFFYRSISTFLNKENIEVATSTTYSSDPSLINIDPKDIVFAFRMAQDDFIKRPYFNITLQDRNYERLPGGELNKTKTPVQMTACTLEHFTQLNSNTTIDWEEKFELQGFQDWLCPPLNYEFKMAGMYSSDQFIFQKISLQLCQNDTDVIDDTKEYSSACAPQEEIDEYAASDYATFSMYFPNKLVNPDSPKKPVEDFLFDEVFFEIQAGRLFRSANIFFKSVVLNTDESVGLWEKNNYQDLTIFEPGDFREMVSVGNDVPGEFFLRRSPYSIMHERKFQKIDDIIAYIGGFLEAIIIGASFIVGYYNELQYTLELANKLYNFEDENKNNKKNFQKINQQIKDLYIADNNNNKNKARPSFKTKHLAKRSSNRLHSMHASDIKAIILERQQLLDKIDHTQYTQDNNRQSNKKNSIVLQLPNNNQQQADKYQVKTPPSNQQQKQQTNNQKNTNLQNQKVPFYQAPRKRVSNIYEGLGFNSRQEYLQSQFKEIIERETQLKLSFKFILNKLLCGCVYKNDDVKLIELAKQNIRKDLDIYMIIDNIKEIEKLKSVIFDKDQERLFNFFPKPIISVQQENNQNLQKIKLQDIKKEHQSIDISNSNVKQSTTNSKYLTNQYQKLTIREIAVAQKAAKKFKKQLKQIRKLKTFGKNKNLSTYQKLYNSYDILSKQCSENPLISAQNKRLFTQLGEELQTIFETSKLIQFEDEFENEIPVSRSQISASQSINISQNRIVSNNNLKIHMINSNNNNNSNINGNSKINNSDTNTFTLYNNEQQHTGQEEQNQQYFESQNKKIQLKPIEFSNTYNNEQQDTNRGLEQSIGFNETNRNMLARNQQNNDEVDAQYSKRPDISQNELNRIDNYDENEDIDINYLDDLSNAIPSENDEELQQTQKQILRDKIQQKNQQVSVHQDFMKSCNNFQNNKNNNNNYK